MAMRHIILILALLCASCSDYGIKPFSLDIQQGNVVTSKMMLQLRPGMSKSQVRFIMGTPLIQDTFHVNRWDYFYQFRKGGKIIEQRRVILDFDQDALAHIRGDVIPAGSGQTVVDPQPVSNSTKTTAKEAQKRSWLDRLQFWKGEDKHAEKPQAAPDDLVGSKGKPPASAPAAPAKRTPAATEPVTPKTETQAAPEPPAIPAPADAKPEKILKVKPALAPAEPLPGPATGPGMPAQPVEPAPQKQIEAPAKQPAPVAPAAIVPAAKPKPASKPEPVAKPTPAAEPDKDLPPEDEPGYFERMLEKIGF